MDIVGKFIADKKIKNVKKIARTTFLGCEVYEVQFNDDSVKEYPEWILKEIVGNQVEDLTILREKTVKPIVKKIMGIFLDAEVNLDDVEYILQKTSMSLSESIKRATEILFNKKIEERTIKDVNDILESKNCINIKNQKKHNKE